jgi:hypothetical protein
MDYDRVFRQQAAIDSNLSWNSIHPGIQAATLVGQASGSPASMCTLCREPDHTATHCALAYLAPPQGDPVTTVPNKPAMPPLRVRYPPRRRPQDQKPICSSWNRGRCIYPTWCTFQHICATCRATGHMARDCKDTPADSEYKRDMGFQGTDRSVPKR